MARSEFDKRNLRRYYLELGGSLALYAVVLIGAISSLRYFHEQPGRTLIALTPVLAIVLMVVAIWRHLNRIDEFQRKLMLEVIALSAMLTAFLTFSYGFLEIAGFPRLSMFAVWPLMGFCWFALGVTARWWYR